MLKPGSTNSGPFSASLTAWPSRENVPHGLSSPLSLALVLTTEDRPNFDILLQAYRDEYSPQGRTEKDLVEELTAAKWLQYRCLAMSTALIDITMDRMEPEITEEFEEIDNAARTALAAVRLTEHARGLDILYRYASRHARDYHRALDKLRLIQKERHQKNPPNEPKRERPQSNHKHLRLVTPPAPKRLPSRDRKRAD